MKITYTYYTREIINGHIKDKAKEVDEQTYMKGLKEIYDFTENEKLEMGKKNEKGYLLESHINQYGKGFATIIGIYSSKVAGYKVMVSAEYEIK